MTNHANDTHAFSDDEILPADSRGFEAVRVPDESVRPPDAELEVVPVEPAPPARPAPGSDDYFATLGELRAAIARMERDVRITNAGLSFVASKLGCHDELCEVMRRAGERDE